MGFQHISIGVEAIVSEKCESETTSGFFNIEARQQRILVWRNEELYEPIRLIDDSDIF